MASHRRQARAIPVRAITLDLDDTLWPVGPVLARAEQRLLAWLEQRFPDVAARYSQIDLHELRERAAREHPEFAHDFSALRRFTLRWAMRPLGLSEHDVEAAFQIFLAARNDVELFEEVPAALARLGRHYRLASISNGNASVEAIGIGRYFEVTISARDVGASKPAPEIFAHALRRLDLAPHEVVHVGDDLELDVIAALAVGMHAVWLDRSGRAGRDAPAPVIRSLDELPALLGTD